MVKSHCNYNLPILLFIQASKGNLNLILAYGESNMDPTDKVLISCLSCIKIESEDHISS